MKRPKCLLPLAFAAIAAALLLCSPALLRQDAPLVPGLDAPERTLLRIWCLGSPGGGQSWLTGQLRAFEKQQPGTTTYLRTAAPEELTEASTVLPDVLLFMPGDLQEPQEVLLPLSGNLPAREALLRSGRWQGQQYALPLCWGAWVMAVDSSIEPFIAATPAPTTLLGRPAASAVPAATAVPGYPLEAASAADCPLQSPGGTALFFLCTMLPPTLRPPLPDNFAQLDSDAVYTLFRKRGTATAVLTTGQVIALESTLTAGQGFPFRVIVPDEIVTDQVWFAGITADAPPEAAALLAFLTSPGAQQALSVQGLHTVRDDLTLYAAGTPAQVEQSGRRAISAVNAFHPLGDVASAAWQAFQGTRGFSEALVPLL